MHIRTATLADIDTLIDFQIRMARETENVALDKSVVRKGLENLLQDSAKEMYYVAEEDGTILGCLMTTYEWSDWRNGTVLWIQSVYVDAPYRGQGLYKKMYEYIKEKVQSDSSLRGIRLYVDKTNQAAQQVYTKLGMNGEHYQVFEWMKG